MSELFDIPETLSPRLAWMKEHQIIMTKSTDCAYDPPEVSFIAVSMKPTSGKGVTENEALAMLAVKLNLKLWNE